MPADQNPGDTPIRVLVSDNTPIHTQLLGDALRRDRRLEVLIAGPRARDLVDAAVKNQIQVAIVSCSLEEEPLRGLEIVRELRTTLPAARTVVLMDSAKREIVVEAFRAGARGIFSRSESLETLGKCVRRVHDGQTWASSEQMGFAIDALASSPSVRAVGANGLDLLSKREMDVVRCLADGLSNREIAERLGLSQHTIKNYLFRVFDKVGVSSRMELLFLALKQPGTRLPAVPKADNSTATESPENALAECCREAEEGIPTAQMELARMHSEGKGVARDAVAAYMWYLVSERTSLDLKDEIGSAKRKLAEILTAEQIIEAQRKAAEKFRKSSRPAGLPARAVPNRLNL